MPNRTHTIWPAPGMLVRDPATMRPIDAVDGLSVPVGDLHWARILQDGDIVLSKPKPPKTQSPAT